ncbi:hypothetical protein F994_02330 [Acinetobacter bohemicus ANC 3994]|jgi:hypothetical protein|uniref:Uncharacterized protein n=1 Tax=Acinetobacter bohemicus ANC 3994 TaxID=1217715 RepID=N8NYL9_9GAMM|nr:hypothetical protein F994_02330 [Acinetobacter bohemicus ANC 3994]CAD9195497.1 hypothetical protein QAC21B_01621 [Acinetobacter bohemicus]
MAAKEAPKIDQHTRYIEITHISKKNDIQVQSVIVCSS